MSTDRDHESGAAPYETSDADTGSVTRWGVLVLFVVVISFWLMRVLVDTLDEHYAASNAAVATYARGGGEVVPPEPRLQVRPPALVKSHFAREKAVLASFAWIDESAGRVRIPIDLAMDLVAERGLPARGAE